MSNRQQVSANLQLEKAKFERMGSYACSVVYSSKFGHVCPVCAGPKGAKFALCKACGDAKKQALALQPGGIPLADKIRFGHYAYKGEQMYRVVQGYKDTADPAVSEYQKDIKYIAADALAVHYSCIARLTGSRPTAWATIPSTKSSRNYGKPHILTNLVSPFMDRVGIQQLHLQANAGKEHNDINPQVFALVAEGQKPDLRHVLLIEDSWVSGATVQSAAAMLRLQGAIYITVYCVARIIDLSRVERGLGKDIADGYRTLSYRDRCPWLLERHPV
ncbi:hypothetical protein LZF93_09930 [Bifidobacterium longum]|uniref:hypothetical protein n=1 Tax=Bifidobacterium longum TaxID=216816 RepID=UPI001F2132C4|nr:hypothetical protein [Bifidobacterium longum]UIP49548.1 hypothetical protein LZF93_09930 [Bifidobacterium longum]